MEPPVEYVGGLSDDAPRARAWPFVAAAAALALVTIAVIVFWGPIRAAGRNAGESFAAYSMSLTSAKWPSDVQLTGVPTTLIMTLQNTDRRKLNGLTLRVANGNPGLTVVEAEPAAEIGGSAIFFPQPVDPGKSETLSITFLAIQPMNSEIDFSLAAAHGANPAQVLTPDGTTVATELAVAAKFRDPTDADANARLVARDGRGLQHLGHSCHEYAADCDSQRLTRFFQSPDGLPAPECVPTSDGRAVG
jgi:hypothetical protein